MQSSTSAASGRRLTWRVEPRERARPRHFLASVTASCRQTGVAAFEQRVKQHAENMWAWQRGAQQAEGSRGACGCTNQCYLQTVSAAQLDSTLPTTDAESRKQQLHLDPQYPCCTGGAPGCSSHPTGHRWPSPAPRPRGAAQRWSPAPHKHPGSSSRFGTTAAGTADAGLPPDLQQAGLLIPGCAARRGARLAEQH